MPLHRPHNTDHGWFPMSNEFNDEQRQFRDVVKRFFTDKSSVSAVRRLMATDAGYDPGVWQQLSADIGLAGAHIPQEYGGYGFGPVELGIIAEEMGRTLYCGPFFASSVMAGYALLEGADEAHKHQLLPGIADGSTLATLVLDNLNQVDQAGQNLRAERAADESSEHWQLTGIAGLVLDASIASLLICVVRTHSGLALFRVDRD